MSSGDLPYASCGKSEATSLCGNSIIYRDLPPDQWKAEVRQLLETSLAQIQYAVLETVRGRSESWNLDYESIPQDSEVFAKWASSRVSVGAT